MIWHAITSTDIRCSINEKKALAMLLTKYRTHPTPDSSECHSIRDDSKTSREKTAPEMAPTAAPLMNPLSVSWPIKAPVIAPNNVPTATKKKTTPLLLKKQSLVTLSSASFHRKWESLLAYAKL